MRHLLAAALLGLLTPVAGTLADGEAPLTIERAIPLGQVRGRIDHMAVDLARRRLLVAALFLGALLAGSLVLGALGGGPLTASEAGSPPAVEL